MERRPANRAADQLRPLSVDMGLQRNADGSVLIATGGTRVICAASVENRVPRWMKSEDGRGWVTAEYAMLPASTGGGRARRGSNSRGTEIQRLIGRSLRAAVDMNAMPGFTITIDCDVLEADGGTRTAAITGGWVALYQACDKLVKAGKLPSNPVVNQVAAISVGVVDGVPLLDLDYPEDSTADVDMNVVAMADGALVEVQGTAEGQTFSRDELNTMLDLAQKGITDLAAAQRRVLGLD
ncbi:MAG TPA: ribonuclease PH [Myxococcales bacterium]|nr:ribonuclease PH [Myxococcales bacterium]